MFAPLLLVALPACQDLPSGPAEPPPVLASQSAGPVVAIANGSGHRVRNGRALVFTFTARGKADGSAEGRYYLDWQDLGPALDHQRLQVVVDVTCMSVSGNTAWVGGIITHVDGPIAQEGTVSYFYVIDNGEGDAVDEISALRLNDVAGEDQVFCRDQPTLLARTPIEKGNAQVKAF
jgi:hypothetical protein